MPEGRSENSRFIKSVSTHGSNRRILVMQRTSQKAQKPLDDGIKSAILAQSKDLSQILQEVDEISKKLKANPADTRSLSEALHRIVLCAIKQSIMERELRSLALTDDLTGLYNRRAFYAIATQQIKVMRRKGQGLLLFFADLDHLKLINDTYGHREGDLALVRAADSLERTFRTSDIICRLSGDEFAVLALEASHEDENTILRRLHENLAEASAEELRYELSMSVGVVRFDPKLNASLSDLLAKADQSMYVQKNAHVKMRMSRT